MSCTNCPNRKSDLQCFTDEDNSSESHHDQDEDEEDGDDEPRTARKTFAPKNNKAREEHQRDTDDLYPTNGRRPHLENSVIEEYFQHPDVELVVPKRTKTFAQNLAKFPEFYQRLVE